MVAQKTVQPEEQLAPGPHTDAYADCGLSTNPTVSTASALPTTPARTRKPRRDVRRDSQPAPPPARGTPGGDVGRASQRVPASPSREVSELVAGFPSACRASAVIVTRRS